MSSINELPTKVVGMSNSAYHGEKGFDSRSFLHTVAKHGGEVQLWIDMGNVYWSGNNATSVGSSFDAIVTGVLSGQKLDDLINIPPADILGANGSRSTKAYKEWASAQTGIICTEDQASQFRFMLNGMYENDAAYDLMQKTVETQVSVFFEIGGHKLKTRPDACCTGRWWDLKTTSHSWDRIYRSVIDYGYAEQEWLYVESAKAVGYPQHRMPFVFVQTAPPYGCRVFYLPEEMVEQAGQRMLNVMEEVRLRRSTGHYMPADSNEIVELAVPAWATRGEEYVNV
jgi:hypothetical protein